MKTAADYCKIVRDSDNYVTNWICRGLNTKTDWVKDHVTFGVIKNNHLLAGLIFHDIEIGKMLYWTIYARDKHWCTRRILKEFMRIAFEVFEVRRINILVDTDNEPCLSFVKKLGFQLEGCLRNFGDEGQNRFILGLLKSENKYK